MGIFAHVAHLRDVPGNSAGNHLTSFLGDSVIGLFPSSE